MTRDPREGIDDRGLVVTGVSRDHLAAPYTAILAALVERVEHWLGDGLHGLYLYGSVATGQARPPTSDIDLFAVTIGDIGDRLAAVSDEFQRRHRDVVRGMAISTVALDDVMAPGLAGRAERCFVRHYTVCLVGHDLRPELPPCRADGELATGFNGELADVPQRVRACLDQTDDPTARGWSVAYGSRRVLMAAATLLAVERGEWSTDRGRGAELLADAAPDLAADVDLVAAWSTLDTTATPMPDPSTAVATLQRLVARLVDRGSVRSATPRS